MEQKQIKMEQQKRIVFLDYLRAVACFLVVMVHANEAFYGTDGFLSEARTNGYGWRYGTVSAAFQSLCLSSPLPICSSP